jgi:uncharacterized protein YbcC (UPF0753/DUF2309 family)
MMSVAPPAQSQYSESERMELRGLVRLASEIIAYYWPMRTFVHHNPLHGLEDLNFEEAGRRAQRLIGGNAYLSNQTFRDYFHSGRILPHHLEAALETRAEEAHVQLGGSDVTLRTVLRACMLHEISPPPADKFDALLQHCPDRSSIASLASHLSSTVKLPLDWQDNQKQRDLGRTLMLANWCDRTHGTEIGEQINRELIKWCETFLDEGHATWPMPFVRRASTPLGDFSLSRNGLRAQSRKAVKSSRACRSNPKTRCSKAWRF